MPRQRNRRTGQQPTQETQQVETTTNSNTIERVHNMTPLTPDQITALLGKARSKGGYETKFIEFVKSGEAGVCANETWAELETKKATTLKQGFENAKTKASVVEAVTAEVAEQVKVLTNEDKVYLINLSLAGTSSEAE